MLGSVETIRVSSNVNDSTQRRLSKTIMDIFVNIEDDADVPIFEGSLKENSSHHVRTSGLQRLGWQGSCRSFAGLDFSDHSTGSIFNGFDKATSQAPKSLLDCFVKTSTDLTVFSENDDDSENLEIKEIDKIKGDAKEDIVFSLDSMERRSNKLHKESRKSRDSRFQTGRPKLSRGDDVPGSQLRGFNKKQGGRNDLSRAKSRTRITSRAKNLKSSTFVYDPLSGKSLVADNMESCSSISFCSLDDDFMGALTRTVPHNLDFIGSPKKDRSDAPPRSPTRRAPLRDSSKDTIPRAPSRSQSPTRV